MRRSNLDHGTPLARPPPRLPIVKNTIQAKYVGLAITAMLMLSSFPYPPPADTERPPVSGTPSLGPISGLAP